MKQPLLINIAAAVAALVLPPLLGSAAVYRSGAIDAFVAEETVHIFGDLNKTCLQWTDGCRTCTRPKAGEPVCSNIGIACQPKPITCVRREEPPKPPETAPKQDGAPK